MKKKLGIVTNPSQLDEQDTFFPFINEAIKRLHLEVYVFDAKDLSRDGKTVMAKKIETPVFYRTRKELNRKNARLRLNEFRLIFLKKDSPIDTRYLRLLKTLTAKKIPTINRPNGILAMGTKAYLKNFPTITPKTFYAHSVKSALEAVKKMGDCILKQSDSYGGKGVIHLSYELKGFYGYSGKIKKQMREKEVIKIIQDHLKKSRDKTLLIVEYFKSAGKRGDKRVVIIEGNRILGSYIRLPNTEQGICVCANNGARRCLPTKRDQEILKVIKPHLKKHGIDLAALDLLADDHEVEYLSEINIVNPGFCNLDVVHPEIHIARQIIDMIEKKMA